MVSANLLMLCFAVIAMRSRVVESQQIGCSSPDDRCTPISFCGHDYRRMLKKEHKTNPLFREDLKRRKCQPMAQKNRKLHICCPKKHIECSIDDKGGVCLLREQCPNLRAISEETLMQSSEKNFCYVHDQEKYFCCTDPTCTGNQRSCEQPRLIPHPKANDLAKLKCGTVGLIDKIQDGEIAQRGEFPWMAVLVYKNPKVHCAGTLIHPSYVLTAHHCLNYDPQKVRLGVHALNDVPPCRSMSEPCARVQEIRIAEQHKKDEHDVGLLRLAKKADIDGDFTKPICLPLYADLSLTTPPSVTIAGWGTTRNGRPSNLLLWAETAVVTGTECTQQYEICAGGKHGKNHCRGDSGGPYIARGVFNGKNRYIQYGVISHGPRSCARVDSLSKGVRVAYVIYWILDTMKL